MPGLLGWRDKVCPRCRGKCYIDTWRPGKGYDPGIRLFICSDCGYEFYLVIKNPKHRRYYDRVLGRG
jgi:ribosomal protein L33